MDDITMLINALDNTLSTKELIAICRDISVDKEIPDCTFTIFVRALAKSMQE